MSIVIGDHDTRQLRTLYDLREKRALSAIAEQRVELSRVLGRLAEQEALITSLQDELLALHQLRDAENINELSASSLLQESARRRWLTRDLEQEIFYLPGFQNDVDDATVELAERQHAWSLIRDRMTGLDGMASRNLRKAHRTQARKDDAVNDDRCRSAPGTRSNGAMVNG